MKSLRASLALMLLAALVAQAAPPTATYLLPAGAQRGTTAEVAVGGTFERWPVVTWCDHTGISVRPHKDKGKLTVTVAPEVPPGVYWIRLADEQGATTLRPFLVGTLPEVAETEPNDDYRKPHTLESSCVVNGRLGPKTDVDCFALRVTKGQTLVASLEANRTLGSPMDAILQILAPGGVVVAENHDTRGLDPHLTYTAPADGVYLVRLYAFPSMPDSTINFSGSDLYVYRLTVTAGPYVEHAFPLAVPRANPGTVELVGWNIPENARRVEVASNGTAFHEKVANVASVRLEPHPTVVKIPGKVPQTLALPTTVSGVLDVPQTADRYSFEAKKGQKVIFQLESRQLDFALSGVLRVTDATGKVLQRVEEVAARPDVALTFAPPQDGTYTIEVGDLFGGAGLRYVYRLRALTARPDYTLGIPADRFNIAPGKPLDIPVTITRDGFAGEIEIGVSGLPTGVKATPVKAKAGDKTATVRLTGEAGAASGSVRVVGTVAGNADLTRAALATVTGQPSTEHVWLTVTK